MVGTKILHYRIEERISARGTGEVYRARDEKLGREVAIKFLPIRSEEQPSAVARFDREARAASALNHPNIITILDTGISKSGRFIVMELVHGVTLREWMKASKEPDTLVDVFRQIAKALSAAHRVGIIHRDIKPENIMVRDDGYVKVLDFGLARWETGREVTPSTKTASGTILGTLRYMSPEQARGEDIPPSSDIFSLGIVLYELVTGKHPFEESTEMATLHAIWTKPILSPRHWTPELSPVLENLILHMLDREPRRRPSADDVARVFDDTVSTLLISTPKSDEDGRKTLVGRHHELVKLRTLLDSVCQQGPGKLVLITGEPGIGKTALVKGLLTEQDTIQRAYAVGKGASSERLARTEAYLPLFEALEDLIRTTPSLAQVMRRAAPNWYDHVIRNVSTNTGNAPGQLKTGSRELLNRELMAFLEEGSLVIPLVLFFDDLHWADESTLDVIAYIAGHFDTARVFVLASYRPEELLLYHERFAQTALDLQSRRRCHTINLDFISVADVEAFLSLEFPENHFPSTFPKLIHTKTEGNPFFMVEVLRYLRDKQVIFLSEDTWRLSEKLPEIERDLPQSIVGMVRRKIDVVTEQDRKLLAAASVQGFEFDSAVLSRTLQEDPAEIEERLERLHRVHGFVQPIEVPAGKEPLKEWRDGSVGAAYHFVHFLYYNAFYSAIQPARKASWSAMVANALVHLSRDRAGEIASQLAFLFEAARDLPQAAHYFSLAADNANSVFAYVEAELLARRGLRMLESLPESPEKLQAELDLQLNLGIPLLAAKGYGNLEVQRIHDRARQLCVQLGDSPRLLPALWGLVSHYAARLELPAARDLATQLLRAAQESGDPGAIMAAHVGAGASTYFGGDFEKALDHFGRYTALDNPSARMSSAARYGLEPGILLRSFQARVLWWLGHLDRCLPVMEESIALARSLRHAPTLGFILAMATTTRQSRGEVNEVEALAKDLIVHGTTYGLELWSAEGGFFGGWVQFVRQPHDPDAGIEQMRKHLDAYRRTGTHLFLPIAYSILAQSYRTIDRVSEGLQTIREAHELACFQLPHPIFFTPEFLRVEAELHMAAGDHDGAEERLLQALEVARRQKTKICELRVATSVCKLRNAQNRRAEGREILSPVLGWFTEGLDTPDLKEAKTLLEA